YKSRKNEKFTARFYRKNDYSLQVKGKKNNKLKLQGIDTLIHMKESLNPNKYITLQEITISRKANKYFASIVMKVEDNKELIHNEEYIGIDLGIKDLSIINDNNNKFKKYHSLNKKL